MNLLYGCPTSATIGILDPKHLVRARYVHAAGQPAGVVAALRRIWATTARRDTTTLITNLLAYDWDHLDAAVTPTTRPRRPDHRPVAGVGIALRGDDEPPQRFALTHARLLDIDWIYLLDPASDTVTVHTDDGDPVTGCRLATHPIP